jgi:hypothetical protein
MRWFPAGPHSPSASIAWRDQPAMRSRSFPCHCPILLRKIGTAFATFSLPEFQCPASGLPTPPSDHTPLSGVYRWPSIGTRSVFFTLNRAGRERRKQRPAGSPWNAPSAAPTLSSDQLGLVSPQCILDGLRHRSQIGTFGVHLDQINQPPANGPQNRSCPGPLLDADEHVARQQPVSNQSQFPGISQ